MRQRPSCGLQLSNGSWERPWRRAQRRRICAWILWRLVSALIPHSAHGLRVGRGQACAWAADPTRLLSHARTPRGIFTPPTRPGRLSRLKDMAHALRLQPGARVPGHLARRAPPPPAPFPSLSALFSPRRPHANDSTCSLTALILFSLSFSVLKPFQAGFTYDQNLVKIDWDRVYNAERPANLDACVQKKPYARLAARPPPRWHFVEHLPLPFHANAVPSCPKTDSDG